MAACFWILMAGRNAQACCYGYSSRECCWFAAVKALAIGGLLESDSNARSARLAIGVVRAAMR